jgi:hypothetical protein
MHTQQISANFVFIIVNRTDYGHFLNRISVVFMQESGRSIPCTYQQYTSAFFAG